MTVDIKPLLKGETDGISFDFELTVDEGIRDVSFPEPFGVKGKIDNRAGLISLELHSEVPFFTRCARCLKEIRGIKTVSLEKTVADESTEDKENDDYIFPVDGEIEIDPLLVEQILLDFPYRHLCSEDCRGLCPKCGKDLNEGPCSCDLSDKDPRFDVLRKLLENSNKE